MTFRKSPKSLFCIRRVTIWKTSTYSPNMELLRVNIWGSYLYDKKMPKTDPASPLQALPPSFAPSVAPSFARLTCSASQCTGGIPCLSVTAAPRFFDRSFSVHSWHTQSLSYRCRKLLCPQASVHRWHTQSLSAQVAYPD